MRGVVMLLTQKNHIRIPRGLRHSLGGNLTNPREKRGREGRAK